MTRKGDKTVALQASAAAVQKEASASTLHALAPATMSLEHVLETDFHRWLLQQNFKLFPFRALALFATLMAVTHDTRLAVDSARGTVAARKLLGVAANLIHDEYLWDNHGIIMVL